MTLYAAFNNNGEIFTRDTSREYTHAVFSAQVERIPTQDGKGREDAAMATDEILGFAGRRDLAEKTASQWQCRYPEVYVAEALPVTVDRTNPDQAPTKDAKWFAQVGDTDLVAYARTKGAVIKKITNGEFD
jgi:hypothetical protein